MKIHTKSGEDENIPILPEKHQQSTRSGTDSKSTILSKINSKDAKLKSKKRKMSESTKFIIDKEKPR